MECLVVFIFSVLSEFYSYMYKKLFSVYYGEDEICKPCPKGYMTLETGSTSVEDCTGKYSIYLFFQNEIFVQLDELE